MARKVHGICCICGKESDLTFEHIPPRAAFNHFNLKLYDFWGYLTQNKTRYQSLQTGLVATLYAPHVIIELVSGMVQHSLNLYHRECNIIKAEQLA